MYIYVFTPIVQLSIINTISTLYLLLISCIWLVSTYSISPPLYPATLCDASKLNATPIRCTCFSCDAHCTVVQFFDILLTSRSLLQYFTNRTLHVMERLANLTKWTLCSGINDIHTEKCTLYVLFFDLDHFFKIEFTRKSTYCTVYIV